MLHDFTKLAVVAVVEAGLDEVKVADGVDLLEEDTNVVVVVSTDFAEVVTMAEVVVAVVVLADVHLIKKDVKAIVVVEAVDSKAGLPEVIILVAVCKEFQELN